MTSAITRKKKLYQQDLNLWLSETIAALKAQDFQSLDIEHLIEELDGLSGRDRRELESRLGVLLNHLLKRIYIPSAENYRGWENTIREQRRQLKLLLKQSPSLRNYFLEVFPETWQNTLLDMRQEYPHIHLPEQWPYSCEVEPLLTQQFWQ